MAVSRKILVCRILFIFWAIFSQGSAQANNDRINFCDIPKEFRAQVYDEYTDSAQQRRSPIRVANAQRAAQAIADARVCRQGRAARSSPPKNTNGGFTLRGRPAIGYATDSPGPAAYEIRGSFHKYQDVPKKGCQVKPPWR